MVVKGKIGGSAEPAQILEETRLNWKVIPIGVRTDSVYDNPVSGILIPDSVAMMRADTKICLGIHKSGYVPYQNDDLLELLFKVSNQTGLRLHSGGYFGNGEKVFIQLKSDDHNLPGGDRVEGNISAINSFDGKTALSFGTSNTTISCMNTFWLAYRSLQTKIRHTAKMEYRIEEILKQVDALLVEEKENFKKIDRLIDVRMTSVAKELVTKMLFNLERDSKLADIELSTNMKNKIENFNADLALEMSQKGDNLWGLFSGVTRYTTHTMKKGQDNTEGKLFGVTGDRERAIWEHLTV